MYIGDVIVTRGITFKTPLDLAETKSNRFINELCLRLAQEFPRIQSKSANNAADADDIDLYFSRNKANFSNFVGETYKFIEEKKITHYISGIDLGAAEYIESTVIASGINAQLDPSQGGTLKDRVKATLARGTYSSRSHTIGGFLGDINGVKIGSGECVIEYEILPVYSLLHHHHFNFKEVLHQATKAYLEKESK